MRLPAARLGRLARRGARRGGVCQPHRQAVRRLRHHARFVSLGQSDHGRGAAQRGEVRLLPRLRLAATREGARRHISRSWSSAPTAPSPWTCATTRRRTLFLKEHGLEEGKFLCCIPRCRNTPYWKIKDRATPSTKRSTRATKAMKEHDHAPLREAIVAVVRQTPMKVLVCPEDAEPDGDRQGDARGQAARRRESASRRGGQTTGSPTKR